MAIGMDLMYNGLRARMEREEIQQRMAKYVRQERRRGRKKERNKKTGGAGCRKMMCERTDITVGNRYRPVVIQRPDGEFHPDYIDEEYCLCRKIFGNLCGTMESGLGVVSLEARLHSAEYVSALN